MYFNPEDWNINGGNHEAASLLLNLAQLHTDWNFYVVGKMNRFNKWEHRKQFQNIINVWDDEIPTFDVPIKYMLKNNIHIDFGLFYAGQVDGRVYPTDKRNVRCSTLNYATPIIDFLNESKIPYFLIGEDPQYLYTQTNKLINKPRLVLTTQACDLDGIKGINVEHDKWVLANEKRLDSLTYLNRNSTINVFTNWKPKKIDKIQSYIWNYWPDTKVYGSWQDSKHAWRPKIEPYSKNILTTPIYEMNKEMYNTKYTLMLSHTKGWRSASKFWKMLLFGIVPFFIPGDDDDHLFNAPEFLYVNSPKELYEKITELENNNSKYIELWYKLQAMLKDDYFNGKFLDTILVNTINLNLDMDLPYSDKTIIFKQSSIIKTVKQPAQAKKLF